jgi:UDP-N-acetylmuramate dehydrogenase
MQLQENISLKQYNTFGIKAYAAYFIELDNLALLETLSKEYAKQQKWVLGGGSNILFTGDIEGLVLHNALKGIQLINEDEDYVYVKVMSGEVWHDWVMYALSHGWYGLENLALIPGTVGAAPIQNIGAYGAEAKHIIMEVEVWMWEENTFRTFNKVACRFGYRDSIFKNDMKDKCLITSVVFKLHKKLQINISYAPLQDAFKAMDVNQITPTLVAEKVIEIRRSKLPDPAKMGNAGSFFKNPVISNTQYSMLLQNYPLIPSYGVDDNYVKIPAAWLIEQCGWKGYKGEHVGVHEKQALVLVNLHNAIGKEVLELAYAIIKSVKFKFNITLSPEVQCW